MGAHKIDYTVQRFTNGFTCKGIIITECPKRHSVRLEYLTKKKKKK